MMSITSGPQGLQPQFPFDDPPIAVPPPASQPTAATGAAEDSAGVDPEHHLQLSLLLQAGSACLHRIIAAAKTAEYGSWRMMVREELREAFPPDALLLTEPYLAWLWESLRHEPVVRSRARRLLPATGGASPGSSQEPIEVLPEESCFRILVNRTDGLHILPLAIIQKPLRMKPGRTGRLECCPVPTDLVVTLPAPISDEVATRTFMVEKGRAEVHGEDAIVHLGSLNQAYTRASLCLESHRGSHGGNIYGHLSWLHDKGEVGLDMIRIAVESGGWTRPLSPHSQYPAMPSLRAVQAAQRAGLPDPPVILEFRLPEDCD